MLRLHLNFDCFFLFLPLLQEQGHSPLPSPSTLSPKFITARNMMSQDSVLARGSGPQKPRLIPLFQIQGTILSLLSS